MESSPLSAGSPGVLHDTSSIDTMDPHMEDAYSPRAEGQEDAMGGSLDERPQSPREHTPTHRQSQSADMAQAPNQQYNGSPSIDPDPSVHARYPTPPISSSFPNPNISRPSSGNSGLSNASYPNMTSQTYQEQNARGGGAPSSSDKNKNSVVIKVGMVGDAQIGKTSLMVKYVEGSWDEDYIQTLGVNFMEKTISIRNTEITFSIWDLGGQREFVNMLPLVCNDAVAILFMFDLTRKSTLNSIKEWYRQGRGFNKTAIPFLVGTKYDHFVNFPREDQEEISNQVASPVVLPL